MFRLPKSVNASDEKIFADIFKQEVLALDVSELPLQQGLRFSSTANENSLSLSILNIKITDEQILVKTGLFYTGTIAGCNCSDDPSVADENNEYCEALFSINKNDAGTTVKICN